MRSSETSDADVPGFRVGKIEKEPSRRSRSPRSGEASAPRRITSLTVAVTVTALLSALLFITVDATQSWRKEIERLDLIATMLVANTDDLPEAAVPAKAQALVGRLGNGLTARLVATPAEAGAPISRVVTLPGDVLLALEAAHDVALTGVALRGGAALALAGAAIFLSLRRTRGACPAGRSARTTRPSPRPSPWALPAGPRRAR